ncbi:MAG: DUF881 domain-containing protein [Clostridiaceae bacterium]|jgi:uncharacterized protein YlxW (UPF0749 family)|nr:DUF881 domain-containing protein [Clostridiaceae bacterium]
MKKGSWIVNLLLYMILGIAIALQFRSTMYSKKEKTASDLSTERLIAQIEQEKKIQEDLKLQIEENNKKKEEYLRSYIASNDNSKLKDLWDNLNYAKLVAGLTDVQGPGIVIKLDDAKVRKTEDVSLLIIHDADIRIILNQLKKAGAQAISINGERIVATSEQLCAGPTIRINKEVYSVPYVIEAIGNPDDLYYSVMMSERVILMRKQGIQVTANRSNKVIIKKYSKDPTNQISRFEVIEQ